MENNKIKAIFSRLYKDAEMRAAIKAQVTRADLKVSPVEGRQAAPGQAEELRGVVQGKMSNGLGFKYAQA